VHNEEMQAHVATHGAVRAALKAMEQHQTDGHVQEAGCWVLKELARVISMSTDTATLSASVQVLLKVLGSFQTSKAVQVAANSALRQLSTFDTGGCVRRVCVGRSGRLGQSTTMRILTTIDECE